MADVQTTHYADDRSYTDHIHDTIVIPKIYPLLGWQAVSIDKELSELKDSDYAIDYHAVDSNGSNIVIQERFRRDEAARRYNDFTLRYKRENNPEEIEQYSEFFKMKGKINRFSEPYYMLYGVVNQDVSDLDKYVVIDLRRFFEYYNNGNIKIDENTNNKLTSVIGSDGILYAGKGYNKDDSSSFISFDIVQLNSVLSDIIYYQKGFIVVRTGNASDKQIGFLRYLSSVNGFSFIREDVISNTEASQLIGFLKDGDSNSKKTVHDVMNMDIYKTISTYLVPNKG